MKTHVPPNGDLLSSEDLARYLNVSLQTVRKWRHRGIGPAGIRLNGLVRYSRSDVDGWIEAQAVADRSARAV